MAGLDAVTFDFWNTLVAETQASVDRRRVLWTEVLLGAGHEVTTEQIDGSFKAAWEFFEGRWKANQVTSAELVAAHGVAALPVVVDTDIAAALVDAYGRASLETPRTLVEGAVEAIGGLRDVGLKVGVVCDVGVIPSAVLRGWLDDFGVLASLDHLAFSDEVGVYKPHPEIFRHALDGLGVADPARAVHIGDIKRTDIDGARAAGMQSVRYRGARDDTSDGADADHVIDHHDELLAVLGLA